MSERPPDPRHRSRWALCALTLAALALAAGLTGLPWGSPATPPAAGQTGASEVTPQTDASVPAEDVLMLGSATAPAETWGIGRLSLAPGSPWTFVRYAPGEGWSLGPSILNGSGQPMSGFTPDESPLAGSMARDGGGALLGSVPASGEPHELLLVRSPGGPFAQTSSEPPLGESERLFKTSRAPIVAALEEGGGHTGALVVPIGAESRVLHWASGTWSSEPIELPAASKEAGGFTPLAVAASSPSNAWLLARLSSRSAAVGLFRRRVGSEGASWQPVAPGPGKAAGEALETGNEPITDTTTAAAQLLSVTDQGVWVDGERAGGTVPVTVFFKPAGEEEKGEVLASWCAPTGSAECTHPLPEPLPMGPSRSFAWPDSSSEYGQRVITGFQEGITLRLEANGEFAMVLARGAGAHAAESVGANFGAAFSSPTEGWLGNELLPVHLTLDPEPDRLEYYPVPFRRPLLAIAPQPGAPIGSLSSQALAVGAQGEVARYLPGEGWQPESLLSIGGRRETPQLRAIAWPTPNRAFAVGAPSEGKLNQMWLWRGETGLWERDPATPVNFDGDLLGIAFDPQNSSRGYAVGQQGVLLRYGKTWTQEPSCEGGAPQPCLPFSPQVLSKTSFSSIAFAGGEALVAYRTAHFNFVNGTTEFTYTGGLLANDGSGWHAEAASALGTDIPWAVAGLPDGGTAVSAESLGGGSPLVLERNAPGAPWQPTPQPYPGFALPGSLTLFREAGALRVIGSGGVPDTKASDEVSEPPAGFPPNLIQPYPLSEGGGYLLRQTATGWRDEEHEHNDAGPPRGNYEGYDEVYDPDPTRAVLVNESGSEGWAAGGVYVGGEPRSQTADIARYPADGSAPPGVGASPVTSAQSATFAIGGGAQCQAPCALRARAGIGPDAWLASALERAGATKGAGARAFIYTGARVSSGKTAGAPTEAFPYARELARYSSLLGSSGLPVHVAIAPSERVLGSECPFMQAFPLSGALPCGSGESDYYSFSSSGVRVLVLDESSGVEPAELQWIEQQLASAKAAAEPAIAVGNADLSLEREHGEGNAAEAAEALVKGGASAYFFDAPEENLELQLKSGSGSIPAYGSGTLGYVSAVAAEAPDFIGASGFLLAEVATSTRNRQTNVAHVSVRLIPDIGELALEAQDGTLLRRSQAARFAGLARRPRAGGQALSAGEKTNNSDTFIPVPENCEGEKCARGLEPEYAFTSSDPEIGEFVKPNLHSAETNAVELGANEQPIPDAKSGLFCAYNAGTTTVTISSGGLSASLPVTVQAGSVRRPCGTTPLAARPATTPAVSAPPPPASSPPASAPASTPPPPVPPPPPLAAPAPAAPHVAARPVHVHAPAPFFALPAAPTPLVVALVPPPIPVAEPTPPSGTSAVTQPVAQKEEEEEEAPESVSNQAVAYRSGEHEPSPLYVLGVVLLAAFAGASLRRRPGRRRREIPIAPATLSTLRAHRQASERRPRRR